MKQTIIAISIILLAGCAPYRPIVDTQTITDQSKYETDLAECQAYAEQVDTAMSAGTGMAAGACIGAGLGAIVGAFFGTAGDGAAFGAAMGGASGLGSGAGHGMAAKRDIVIRCMQGRGYRVLH